jgi:hypothetical protein
MNIDHIGPCGQTTEDPTLVVAGAVVPTLTVTVCVPLPLICTEELDRLQVGAGVTTGVIAQLRFTVLLNDPVPANERLKLALCPALIVWEAGEPEAAPTVKSGGPCIVSVIAGDVLAIKFVSPEYSAVIE